MILIVTALSVLAFIAAFELLGLVPRARMVIATSRQAAAVMGDKSLDDEAKETAVQQAATRLMLGFFGLALRIALLLFAAYVPILLADLAGLVPEAEVLGFMLRIDVILITTLLVIALIVAARKVRAK